MTRILLLMLCLFCASGTSAQYLDESPLSVGFDEEDVKSQNKNYRMRAIASQRYCACEFGAWTTEFHVFECHPSYSQTDNETVLGSHNQLNFSLIQRYTYNVRERNHFKAKLKQGINAHPYSMYFNKWGWFAGIEYYGRELDFKFLGNQDTDSSEFISLPFGGNYYFKTFWDSVLHSVDLGMYVTIPLGEFNNRILARTEEPNTVYGIYFAVPTYFSVNNYMSIGFKLGMKYALVDLLDSIEGSRTLDMYLGVAARFSY